MKEKYAEFVELSNQGIKELDLGTCDFLLKTWYIKNRFAAMFFLQFHMLV